MVLLPIQKKLKKNLHRTIALSQDLLVMEIYNFFPRAVLHGGTALWRCFGSNRFSEDVDVYFPTSVRNYRFKNFLEKLKDRGFTVEKFKKTNNSIFAKFSFSGTITRLEAVFKNVKIFVQKNYETFDGNFMVVNTLPPEILMEEKISAYLKRRKVRDLYDIFFLSKIVEKNKVKNLELIKKFKEPVDEKELKALIIVGSIPSATFMLEEVRRWVK